VIFPAGVSQSDRYPTGRVTDYWTPTADDVRQAELRIHSYLAENASLLVSKFSSYGRQYTGFYLDGQKLISAFFFCDPPPPDDLWCKPFGVDDGGDCYFHIEYDVANDQCGKLDVNGST